MSRRLPALVVLVAALVALVIVGRDVPAPVVPAYADVTAGWMPAAPIEGGLTGSWFCPGVPATGEEGVGGEVVISNAGDVDVTAQVQWLSVDANDAPADLVTVAARSIITLDAAEGRTSPFVSAVVEVQGEGVVVEQRAIHPAGSAVSPCANSTSAQWYLAEGFTVGGSRNEIVLTNPHEDVVIVDVGFATAEGSRAPLELQGIPIPPRSVQVIDLGAPGAGAQGEERLAVQVEATRGRLVVGRAQHFLAGGRSGFTMSLASPALRDQWWFADGEKGAGVSERFSIYNPTSSDVEVDVIFLGVPADGSEPDSVVVPARQVVVVDVGQIATLAEGRHATVFSTRAEPSVVVERVLTRTVDGQPSSSVLLGGTPRPDGYVATSWRMVAGPERPTAAALVVYNVDNSAGTISISSVGPDGLEPIPGLTEVELPPASIRTIDLIDEAALGRELVISSTTRVFVERSLFGGDGGRRTSSWALPVG